MSNPYSPPKAPIDDTLVQPEYSDEYRRTKSALRPLGFVLVVFFFFVFSAAEAALLLIDGDNWWVVSIAITGLMTYWFRKLWWGDERERKIAVFLCFFIAALSLLGNTEGSVSSWSAGELVGLAEGGYFFLASCYLIHARKNAFFRAPRAS